MLTPVIIRTGIDTTEVRLTSRAMTKVKIFSLTRRNTSGSFSNSRALSTPAVRWETTTSQSSSTSLQDRKVPVVSKTRDSTKKKPSISCVNASREDNGRGVGRIKSDWAWVRDQNGTIDGRTAETPFYQLDKRLEVLRAILECRIYVYTQTGAWSPPSACHYWGRWLFSVLSIIPQL